MGDDFYASMGFNAPQFHSASAKKRVITYALMPRPRSAIIIFAAFSIIECLHFHYRALSSAFKIRLILEIAYSQIIIYERPTERIDRVMLAKLTTTPTIAIGHYLFARQAGAKMPAK